MHDMIYASGAPDLAARCFDAAAIDNNFFNGHGIDARPEYVAAIVNYAANAGFKEVVVGLYAERLILAGASPAEIESTFFDALESTSADASIAGLEIGGYSLTRGPDYNSTVMSDRIIDRVARLADDEDTRFCARAALVYSNTSLELWQGDYAYDRNIHQDALLGAFRLLKSVEGLDVSIVSAETLASQLPSFDVIYLPHVSAPSPELLGTIRKAIGIGVTTIQDVRFGEFNPDGSLYDGTDIKDLFGVGRIEWLTGPVSVDIDRRRVEMDQSSRSYATMAAMAPGAGASLEGHIPGRDTGIWLRKGSAISLGFLPDETPTNRDVAQSLLSQEISCRR